MIPATCRRDHPAECTTVGDYIPAFVMPCWWKDRTREFSPELHQLTTAPLPEFHSATPIPEPARTVWLFEPRRFVIDGDRVTRFVRIK